MLRFNCTARSSASSAYTFQYILCYGSTEELEKWEPEGGGFQYILCYGSTFLKSIASTVSPDFNTSYVTVQLTGLNINTDTIVSFQYILCYGSTEYEITWWLCNLKFQYILCYGSTSLNLS